MKKILLTTLASTAVAAGALAQGQIGWLAGASTLIQASADKTTAISVPTGTSTAIVINSVNYGGLNLDFFVNSNPNATLSLTGPGGTPDFTGWTDLGVDLNKITPTAGKMSTTVLNLPASGTSGTFTPGNDVRFEVVGWTGTATSWTAALANLSPTTLIGFGGETFNGTQLGSLGWDQPTGNPNKQPAPDPAAAVPTGAAGFGGLVLEPVPEPTTIALGGKTQSAK